MKKIKVNPPLYEAEPVSSVKELLNNASAKCGDRIAFSYKEKDKIVNVTYSQFLADTIALGTALHKIGVCGSHIACIGENSYKWITVYLTVLKSSGVFVPIDKELPTDDIINIVNSSDSEVLFYSAKYEKQIFDSQDRFKNVKYFIGFDRETDEGNNLGYDEFKENGMYLYADGYDEYLNEQFSPDDLKMLVYTSGTTGMAKGVMLSERNLLSCVYYGLQVSKVYDRCLSVLPYSHTYESVAGILVSLHHHSTICINDNLKNLLRNMQTFKPDYIYVVPAFAELFYKKIWASAEQSGKASLLRKTIKLADTLKLGKNARRKMFSSIHEAFGGNLKKIVCGGAPIRAELGDFFESVGITLVNGY
jgi:long-chain acyl-CoA synthetase